MHVADQLFWKEAGRLVCVSVFAHGDRQHPVGSLPLLTDEEFRGASAELFIDRDTSDYQAMFLAGLPASGLVTQVQR